MEQSLDKKQSSHLLLAVAKILSWRRRRRRARMKSEDYYNY
jgi:hypothetical protein